LAHVRRHACHSTAEAASRDPPEEARHGSGIRNILMSRDRFHERQAGVQAAVSRLQEAVAQPEGPIVRDAVIQRFEFSFELVWKTLKLYLERQGRECGGPRAVLKLAFAEGIISALEEADIWLRMLEDRNLTSHAYDEALAARIYRNIARDYAPALATMANRIRELTWD
jgi:nucleotidyltransferase substrate binding protein (TIGR01987 family)